MFNSKKKIQKKILDALAEIRLAESDKDIVDSGLVSTVIVKENDEIGFAIEVDPSTISADDAEKLRKLCEQTASNVDGVKKATVVLTAKSSDMPEKPAKPKLKAKHIIAVASGKGGVGKSTVSANLAVSLAKSGYKVGLVDADILGPSQARMMGINQKPESENGVIIPIENHGVKFLSTGLLVDENAPIVWRGPMVSKALAQLINGANWGELDYMILDLPPGTGDIQISLSKHYPLEAALIVTTPQEVAIMDVKKAIGMFEKMNIDIIGIVENMSYFVDQAGEKHFIFGKDKVEAMADELSLNVIAQIPLIPEISEGSDTGNPYSIDNSNDAKTFVDLTNEVVEFFKD